MRLVNQGTVYEDRPVFVAEAEYGIQVGQIIKRRIEGCKTREECEEIFDDYLKRNYPVEYKKCQVKIWEIVAEPVDEEAV